MKVGSKIRHLRKHQNLTLQELANKAKISLSYLGDIEKGRSNPSIDTLKNIAKALETPASYFLDNELTFDLVDLIENYNRVPLTAGGNPISQQQRLAILSTINNPANPPTDKKPILGTIRAGLPILAEEHWEEEIEVPASLNGDFALRVEGDSMLYAGINPGDIAIFKKADTAQYGQIVAAGVQDITWEANLKFYIQKNGQIFLRSANPNYKDIEFGPNHRIIGVMVGLIRENSPSLMDFENLLQIKNYQDSRWIDVIETAITNGLEPEHVKQVIEMQAIMAQKLQTP